MSHADFDKDIEELAEDHEEVEATMLAAILAYLAGEITLSAAMARVEEAASALLVALSDWVEDVLPAIYEDGRREALRALDKDGPEAPEDEEEDSSRQEPPEPPEEDEEDDSLHQETLALFQEDLVERLAATTDQMDRDAKAALREIARRNIAAQIEGRANPRLQASVMAKEMEERGVRFTDRSGRRWKPRHYAETVLRDAATDTANEAHLNTAAQIGSPGVFVSDGGPGDVDEACLVANGQSWSLSYARLNKREHPRCRRAFAPLATDWEGELDKQ